jgi:carbamoyl-phosphate synthase small subunit
MAEETDQTALLVLEDGTFFEGRAQGASGSTAGEVVFNTSMSGYQEILTDPSYAGQLVTLTMPHVGNYGVNAEDLESSEIRAAGLIVRGMSERPSNHRAEMSLPEWLDEQGVVAISEVDTRAITRVVREEGVMMGVIAHDATANDVEQWLEYLDEQPDYDAQDFVSGVVCSEPRSVSIEPLEDDSDGVDGDPAQGRVEFGELVYEPEDDFRPHVMVVDYGVKFSILRHLHRQGFRLTIVPPDVDMETVERLQPDGTLLSNGPGDPARLDDRLELVERLAETYPTFGICMGHQLLGRALGAETFKLQFGHRGPNQPVKDLSTGHVAMTSQNHGFAVDADSMPDEVEITHINLNDDTVEGFRHRDLPIFGVQYHPEAGPGPHDAIDFFEAFADTVREASNESTA